MIREEKEELIGMLINKLGRHSTDFGLGETDHAQIAEKIVKNFVGYAAYRNGDEWEKEEGYKWNFIRNRFQEQNEQTIPDYLPDIFFDSIGNLCGDYRSNLFIDGQIKYKIMWNEYQEEKKGYISEIFANNNIEEKLRKANELIIDVTGKKTAQSIAVLLFYLYPKTFFPYNYTSLTMAAKSWGCRKILHSENLEMIVILLGLILLTASFYLF